VFGQDIFNIYKMAVDFFIDIIPITNKAITVTYRSGHNFGKKSWGYKNPKLVAYQKELAIMAHQYAITNKIELFTKPIEMHLVFQFLQPASFTESERIEALNGFILPSANYRYDLDNLAKPVIDSFKKIFYMDDAIICNLYTEKRYAEHAGIQIKIDYVFYN